jgi:calcineurin-like phosphoesterase family protein
MKTWLSADYHIGENRFELMGRTQFKTTDEHNNFILKNHNALVKPDDVVIIVGDAVYQKAPEYLPFIKKFNGIKTLIRGNHDKVFTDKDLEPYFENIIDEGDGLSTSIEGIDCWLTHYPTTGKKDKFTICGHIHSAWKYQLNEFNVGIDVNSFMPVNLDKIPFHFTAIKDFYDNDVWVAYNEINAQYYKNGRGKDSSYFQNKKS